MSFNAQDWEKLPASTRAKIGEFVALLARGYSGGYAFNCNEGGIANVTLQPGSSWLLRNLDMRPGLR